MTFCLLVRAGAGPQYSGNFDGNIDQSMIDDIFGAGLDTARYGNTEEEWVEVPITSLPHSDTDDCQPIKSPRSEPELQKLYEELQKIEVIKADGSKKCDFYRETEGFECVPYYQCDDGQIITDGAGLIDIRFGGSEEPEVAVLDATDLMCPGSLDICCKDPDFVTEKEEFNNPYGPSEELVETTTTPTTTTTEAPEYEPVYYEEEYSQEDISSEEESDGYNPPVEPDSSEEESEEDGGYVAPAGKLQKLVKFQPQCGRRNRRGVGVSVGGYQDGEAQFGEWPHMCAILKRDIVTVEVEVEGAYGGTEIVEEEETILVFVGGASLIAPGVVLTGAHKVQDYPEDPSSLVVRCGEWDTQTESEIRPHQDRNVSRVVLHPEFNKRSLWNSIAVLFVETDFILDEHVDTICLPEYEENFEDRSECFVKVRQVQTDGMTGLCVRAGARNTSGPRRPGPW